MTNKEKKIKDAFSLMDKNGDGEASKEEVIEMFKTLKGG